MKTVETVSYEIMREIVRVHHLFKAEKMHVYASKEVADYLINEESHAMLAELQAFIGAKIEIKVEPYYHQEQFDVVVM